MNPHAIIMLLCALLATVPSGCSVYMAATQPDPKDLSVLSPGTPRTRVIAALGAPVVSETRGQAKIDTFVVRQGSSRAAKTARALFYGAADVFTLGLWEVIGTPIEIIARGRAVRVEVAYDENDRVRSTATNARPAEATADAVTP